MTPSAVSSLLLDQEDQVQPAALVLARHLHWRRRQMGLSLPIQLPAEALDVCRAMLHGRAELTAARLRVERPLDARGEAGWWVLVLRYNEAIIQAVPAAWAKVLGETCAPEAAAC